MKFARFSWVAFALILLSCVDPEARSYDDFVEDYERVVRAEPEGPDVGAVDMSSGPDMGEVDPVEPFPDVCSPAGGDSITVNFVNTTSTTGVLVWVDFDCDQVEYARIEPGGAHQQSTFVGHVWRLNDESGDALDQAIVEAGDGTIELGVE